MARVGLLDHVGRESADGVDAFEFERRALVGRELRRLVVRLGVDALRGRLVGHDGVRLEVAVVVVDGVSHALLIN
mgnify:CR=1 FL=1